MGLLKNKTAIIVCTRLKSSRVPGKCGVNINGKILLEHLNSRLQKTNLPIIYAIPDNENEEFSARIFPELTGQWRKFIGHASDPMKRMYYAAKTFGIENIIRVTHDKIFLDPDDLYAALNKYNKLGCDYLYSSDFTDGVGFEIIKTGVLGRAVERFKDVEHISYAIKAVTDKSHNLKYKQKWYSDIRLLVDFPEDIELLNLLFSCLGNECSQAEVYAFLEQNPWAKQINKKPICTVYTCAYNSEKWLEECMISVANQFCFKEYEYLLIDDHSSDKTPYMMARFASRFRNSRFIRNHKNLGLASSSNVALSQARGRYIVRLDADDYFCEKDAIVRLMEKMESSRGNKCYDVIYPNYFHGNRSTLKRARYAHHVGGALFNTRAINHIKFTEGLRGHDSLDIWLRARETLNIGYLASPVFLYRQHESSMSKTNLKERERIKRELLNENRN